MLRKKFVQERDVVVVTFEVPLAELPEGLNINTIRVVGEYAANQYGEDNCVVATPEINKSQSENRDNHLCLSEACPQQ